MNYHVFLNYFVVFCFALLFPALSSGQSIRLLFCGDFIPHKGVKRSAIAANRTSGNGQSTNYGGFYNSLSDLKNLTKSADVSFCNLETPVVKPPAGDPYCFKTRGDFYFKAPPVAIDALKWAGFSVVSLANNHIDNAGVKGIISTLDILKKKKITAVGAGHTYAQAHDPVIITVKGIKIAFLAFCSSRLGNSLNVKDQEKPHVCRVDPRDNSVSELYEDISYAKAQADLVVLSFHWGPYEYKYEPADYIVKFGRECAERGVSIIAGHHPHVLQKAEYYKCKDGRKAFIMWSLGNMISNQSPKYDPSVSKNSSASEKKARRREGAAVIVTIDSKSQPVVTANSGLGVQANVSVNPHVGLPIGSQIEMHTPNNEGARMVVSNVVVAPLWTDNNYLAYAKGVEEARVSVISVNHEINRLQDRITFLKKRRKRIKLSLQGKLQNK